jgi:hypothetical protein
MSIAAVLSWGLPIAVRHLDDGRFGAPLEESAAFLGTRQKMS